KSRRNTRIGASSRPGRHTARPASLGTGPVVQRRGTDARAFLTAAGRWDHPRAALRAGNGEDCDGCNTPITHTQLVMEGIASTFTVKSPFSFTSGASTSVTTRDARARSRGY